MAAVLAGSRAAVCNGTPPGKSAASRGDESRYGLRSTGPAPGLVLSRRTLAPVLVLFVILMPPVLAVLALGPVFTLATFLMPSGFGALAVPATLRLGAMLPLLVLLGFLMVPGPAALVALGCVLLLALLYGIGVAGEHERQCRNQLVGESGNRLARLRLDNGPVTDLVAESDRPTRSAAHRVDRIMEY
jgi:hypothetical protein